MARREVSGLDTSVVLRLLLGAPEQLATVAAEFVQEAIAEGGTCLVSDLVISEAYFALQAHYEVPKRLAVEAIYKFVATPGIQASAAALEALQATLASGSKPGLLDRMIHAQYAPARLVTFERAAGRLPGVLVLRTT